MRLFDVTAGLVVTTGSAIASTALLVWILRSPLTPGDVVWPALLVASAAFVCAWIGVWAWASQRWLLAAPTIFIGSLGAVGLMSMLALIPMGFAGLALCRALRRHIRIV